MKIFCDVRKNLGGCVRNRLASEILFHCYQNRPDFAWFAVTDWDSRFDFHRMRIPNDSTWQRAVAFQQEGAGFESHGGQGLFCVELACSHLLTNTNIGSKLKRVFSFPVSAIPLNRLLWRGPTGQWMTEPDQRTHFVLVLPLPAKAAADKKRSKDWGGGGGRMAVWGVGAVPSGTDSYYKWASHWIPQQSPLIGRPVVFVPKRVR